MADLSPQGFAPTKPLASAAQAQDPQRAAAGAVVEVFEPIVQTGTEISMRQATVLARAVQSPGKETVRSLAAAMKVSKPAITRALDRLDELKLAHRLKDPKDRRSIFVQPTSKGRAWVAAVAKTLGAL
ncbi:MarR family transcriptional regulator [Roseomonas xinghualingensis]|uniref:MarR family transcriptional regulator n=1 Tax=Roseomonas xinghualingensis TaxID=2986475 RepID=UPI0021F1A2A6|nr:MarR family transcriptional regulator [Roseomonas sp. SXEYE001]MCV4207544.1 MarR family transcriptional regulator [Roseomonas sp. SXEYE001]